MQCSTPTCIKGQWFPCGHCIQCRIAKAAEWSYRLTCELGYWPYAVFITLTYSEDNCPLGLCKKDLQKFHKRLRKYFKNRKFKYFSCGEYGPTTCRPHYHGIYFGLHVIDKPIIEEKWGKGFVTVSNVNDKRIRYVTSYVLKKYGKKENLKNYEEQGIENPFQLCSQGLGLRYCLDHSSVLLDNLGDTFGRRNICLPRYYCRKLDIDTSILHAISVNRQKLLIEQHNKHSKCKVNIFDIDLAMEHVYHNPYTGQTCYYNGRLYENQAIREIGEAKKFITNSLMKLREKKHIL